MEGQSGKTPSVNTVAVPGHGTEMAYMSYDTDMASVYWVHEGRLPGAEAYCFTSSLR